MRPILLALLLVLPGALLYPAQGAPVLPLGDCASETSLAGSANWFQKGYINSIKVTNPSPANQNDVRHTSIETNGCVSGKCLKVSMKQFATTAFSVLWPDR
jgi:hypothetical protein